MKLPNYEHAVVAKEKLTGYLLNDRHVRGRHKAEFFVRFGFALANWELLAQALLQHAATHSVATMLATDEGVHYVVDGELQTPDVRNPSVRSVWAIDTGSMTPRFITAYPLQRT